MTDLGTIVYTDGSLGLVLSNDETGEIIIKDLGTGWICEWTPSIVLESGVDE